MKPRACRTARPDKYLGTFPHDLGTAMMRRFPPPWSIEELNDACFVVKDSKGQALRRFFDMREFAKEKWPKRGPGQVKGNSK
jgi:hypothetical protein